MLSFFIYRLLRAYTDDIINSISVLTIVIMKHLIKAHSMTQLVLHSNVNGLNGFDFWKCFFNSFLYSIFQGHCTVWTRTTCT